MAAFFVQTFLAQKSTDSNWLRYISLVHCKPCPHANEALVDLLDDDMVITHPMIAGEIASGAPPAPRSQTLADLSMLPTVQQVGLQEATALIKRESIYGRGCGLIDLILLASPLITAATALWTLNQRLDRIQIEVGGPDQHDVCLLARA